MSYESFCSSPFGIHVSVDVHKMVTDNCGILELFWPVGTEVAYVVEKAWLFGEKQSWVVTPGVYLSFIFY